MLNKEKSIRIIEFSGKKTDWDSWSEKFLLHGKQKGYKKLLVSTGTTPGVDKIPMQEEYKSALEEDEDLNKKIVNLILLINTSSSVGKVAFGLVKNA